MTLVEFVSNYYLYHGELRKNPSPVVVHTFPQHPSNPCGEWYGQYCKYQLPKHKPWQGLPSNAWGDVEDTDTTCIQAYHSFLCIPEAESCIPLLANELDQAQQYLDDTASTDVESEEPPNVEEQDEWMLLCHQNPHFTEVATTQDESVDWVEAAQIFPFDVL